MIQIQCAYCGKIVHYATDSAPPTSCPECFSPLEAPEEEKGIPFELVCQQSGARVKLTVCDNLILGRSAEGAQFFSPTPQISRQHCQIENKQGVLYVTDLNSTNGTYLGAGRVDCWRFPEQQLQDGDILYLGKEPFLIQLNRGSAAAASGSGRITAAIPPSSEPMEECTPATPTEYECRGCRSYTSPSPGFTCPKCHTWND